MILKFNQIKRHVTKMLQLFLNSVTAKLFLYQHIRIKCYRIDNFNNQTMGAINLDKQDNTMKMKKKKLNQDIGDNIINNDQLVVIQDSFYRYKNLKWELIDGLEIKKLVKDKLKEYDIDITNSKISAVIDYLKIELDTPPKQNRSDIFFQNGFYNPTKNKFTPYSEKHKEDYIINYIDSNYNEDAKYQKWEKFLEDIFKVDEDKKQKAELLQEKLADKKQKTELLQEYLAYCLTKRNNLQKSLFLYGGGSNGKSVILEVLEDILSSDNVSNIPFEDLKKEAYLIQLKGKYVNIVGEINERIKNPTNIFKRLVGSDKIVGKKLFNDPTSFVNTAKLIFAVNHLPFTSDNTNGFYRKVMILKFNNQFTGKDVNINLVDELKEEKEGIIQWLITGLLRLNKNKGFTIPKSSEDVLKEYKEESDPTLYFVNTYCELTNKEYIKYSELYKKYEAICREYRFKPLSKLNFKKDLMIKFPEVRYGTKRYFGKTHRSFVNIILKSDNGKQQTQESVELF